MDYLLFSLVPAVTFLGWLLWVRWDSRRYLNQRRIERRLTDYPLRGTEDERAAAKEIMTTYERLMAEALKTEPTASARSSEEAR